MLTLDKPSGRITALISFIVIVLLLSKCETAAGQEVERAKTVSAERKTKKSFYYYVCVQTESGKRHTIKYPVHCWSCEAVIPNSWNVFTRIKRNGKQKVWIEEIK